MDPTSSLEPVFNCMMRERGIVFDGYQTAIGPYNVDFTLGRVAVETSCRSRHTLYLPSFEERTRYLFDRGWSLLVFWIDARKWILTPEVADYAAALIQETRSNPPPVCEYRVVWGAGEFVARKSAEDDDLSLVRPFRSCRNPATGRYESVAR
jgi:very-short-patch-repair endonuclease